MTVIRCDHCGKTAGEASVKALKALCPCNLLVHGAIFVPSPRRPVLVAVVVVKGLLVPVVVAIFLRTLIVHLILLPSLPVMPPLHSRRVVIIVIYVAHTCVQAGALAVVRTRVCQATLVVTRTARIVVVLATGHCPLLCISQAVKAVNVATGGQGTSSAAAAAAAAGALPARRVPAFRAGLESVCHVQMSWCHQ